MTTSFCMSGVCGGGGGFGGGRVGGSGGAGGGGGPYASSEPDPVHFQNCASKKLLRNKKIKKYPKIGTLA